MNMIEKQSVFKRFISILVCAALMISYLPMASLRTFAADAVTDSADIVADAGTAHTWETMMGTSADGNRYAGRVWADKSVYTDGQLALLNSSGAAGSTFRVDLEEDEAFQIIFSALGSSMTTTSTNSYVGPMDVALVLDTSISMATTKNGKSRLESTLIAANALLSDLLTIPDVRIAIVTYNEESRTVLPLASGNSFCSRASIPAVVSPGTPRLTPPARVVHFWLTRTPGPKVRESPRQYKVVIRKPPVFDYALRITNPS
jgi:hypothetical protein